MRCPPSLLGLFLLRLCYAVLILSPVLIPAPLEAKTATPRQRLDQAIIAYRNGGYREAAAELSRLLYPLKLTDREQIVQAKVYLGLSYYVLGRAEEAADEFRAVFKIHPKYGPDPLNIPPEIIRFIENLRPPPLEPPRTTAVPGLGEQVLLPDLRSPRFSALNLMPLGIPQFRHGDFGRGTALAATELSLLALNVSSYWYLWYWENTKQASEELRPCLFTARAVNISSFSLLALTLVVGSGDALYRYRKPPEPLSLQGILIPGPSPEIRLQLRGSF